MKPKVNSKIPPPPPPPPHLLLSPLPSIPSRQVTAMNPVSPQIAIVGMACQYPDARSPQELWENVLAQRRAFRRLPTERLSLADYFSTDPSAIDYIYSQEAAVIEGYEFDRVKFKVVGSTYRSADLAHWLALDVAAQALADAGFAEGQGLPREATGVLLGNTLTGEMSRANTLRLRWPYVRRVVNAQLQEQGKPSTERQTILQDLENRYKAPFVPMGEESLAGNLSNTIAGRICNYFDLKGGGYTIDGACSSSLLAIAQACSALVAGDLEIAIAGGVDLSIDPFELVGFARAGALTKGEMWVYDQRSGGFIPGEGCGFVVLMPYEQALLHHKRIYGVIRGWGISSDGQGGITRPTVEGQLLALERAYRRAGFGIETVGYFEGHGTGTAVGDSTELQVLIRARQQADPHGLQPPAVLGSIKSNIGHTKAAAGMAGLIKATLALHHQLIPPITGCGQPHSQLSQNPDQLTVSPTVQSWLNGSPIRVGVSAMGFGGINTHLVIEGANLPQRQKLTILEHQLIASPQDTELFLFSAPSLESLVQKVQAITLLAPQLSRAEVGDIAVELAKKCDRSLPFRAAVVANCPQDLNSRLQQLLQILENQNTTNSDPKHIFLGVGNKSPRIGFLFPGQAAPVYLKGGCWVRRFTVIQDLYQKASLPQVGDLTDTAIAQPTIITASLAGLTLLQRLGIEASVAVGHSLGELAALHWAGAYDVATLLDLAKTRGQMMNQYVLQTGIMASIGDNQRTVEGLLNGRVVAIAGLNSPQQTVISGDPIGVKAAIAHAQAQGLRAIPLPVSHAFHSPLMAAMVDPFAEYLVHLPFTSLQKTVISTVTGERMISGTDLRSQLCRQLTDPVRFMEAVTLAAQDVDLLIEVGSGQILSRLTQDFLAIPAIALDCGGESLKGLWQAVGAAFCLGANLNLDVLWRDRFTRPFDLNKTFKFFSNPCELAPHTDLDLEKEFNSTIQAEKSIIPLINTKTTSKQDCLRQLIAQRTELPPDTIGDHHRLLSDLHLNSITVGQLVSEAARRLGLTPPLSPTDYADASIAEIAQAFENLSETTDLEKPDPFPLGVDSWVRPFIVDWVEQPLPTSKVQNTSIQPEWQLCTLPGFPLRSALETAINGWQGKGAIVGVSINPTQADFELWLTVAQHLIQVQAAEPELVQQLIFLQSGRGSAAFARCFFLENPQIVTKIINIPFDSDSNCGLDAIALIEAEIQSGTGYREVTYDRAGHRRIPVLKSIPFALEQPPSVINLDSSDLLLVTGGGKGIAAESAIAIAQSTGVRLALIGRAQSVQDKELKNNLARIQALGIEAHYFSCDISQAQAVSRTIAIIQDKLGTVTALLHGAGVNTPKLIKNLTLEAFQQTLQPKVMGLDNLLTTLNCDRLRYLITFGSIIARLGLPGEADYAVANDWLDQRVGQFQANYPQCYCLNLEWSVWSGTGMGERLGRIDSLLRQGITPIPTDTGIAVLRQLLHKPRSQSSLVIAGRFGDPTTINLEKPELPFLRFLEQPRVYYPGIELVVDAELSPHTDPYLQDHIYQGELIFPGVMGLEAMAQVAQALLLEKILGDDQSQSLQFRSVQFNHPIVIPPDHTLKIRIAALVEESGQIKIVLRSEQTGFVVDHFTATLSVNSDSTPTIPVSLSTITSTLEKYLNPQTDLYGELLFHGDRFQKITRYRQLSATKCLAEIAIDQQVSWFSRYLPQELTLGEPAARDAVIHALQACVPHATILPTGIEQLTIYSLSRTSHQYVSAQERQQIGDRFIYDLLVFDEQGKILEEWLGLELRIIKPRNPETPWNPALLPAYLERQVKVVTPNADLTLLIDQDATVERRVRSDRLLTHFLGQAWHRRPDGKPKADQGQAIAIAHAGDLTLGVLGSTGCDLEPVVARNPAIWHDLLGTERLTVADIITRHTGESLDTAATRVWSAGECLKKAGLTPGVPLMWLGSTADGWVWLSAGDRGIATFVVSVMEVMQPLVFAVLVLERAKCDRPTHSPIFTVTSTLVSQDNPL